MNIYILIILCFYTLTGIFKTVKGAVTDEPDLAFAGAIVMILGIIAIIFQSIILNQ